MKARSACALFLVSFCLIARGQAREDAGSRVPALECAADQSLVVILRDDRLKGSAIHTRILLDGRELGEITRGQEQQYCVSAEEHIVGVASDFFGGMGAQKRELAVDFKACKTYAFRIFILHAQGATIERTAL